EDGEVGPDGLPLGQGAPPSGTLTPATAAQDLLAELAVITRERPNDSRHVLVTLPRDWAPDPEVVSAQLDALEAVPWVRLQPVAALIGLADPGIDRGTLPDREVRDAEIRAGTVAGIRQAVDRRRDLAEMVDDPDAVVGDAELELLAPLAVAWRQNVDGRDALLDASRDLTAALAAGVRAQAPTEIVNLISRSGDLTLRVTNDLPWDVDVVVGLRPSDPRLRVDETIPVTIPAQ